MSIINAYNLMASEVQYLQPISLNGDLRIMTISINHILASQRVYSDPLRKSAI